MEIEPLFPDNQTFSKHRPTKITDQQEADFYLRMAKEVIDEGFVEEDEDDEDQLDDIAHDLKGLSPFYNNGYDMAKELESSSSRAYYEIDTSFCEWLDDLDYKFRKVLNGNVETWVKAHDPQPLFAPDTKLLIDTDLNTDKKKGDIVYVTGFEQKTARYIINKDPLKKGAGTLIEYEEVEAKCQITP